MSDFSNIEPYPPELLRLIDCTGEGFRSAVNEQRLLGLTQKEAYSKVAKLSMNFFNQVKYNTFYSYKSSKSYSRRKQSDFEKVINRMKVKTNTPH